MIERKLQQAADALPENKSDFSAVESRIAEKANRPKPARRRRLAIAMALAVLLVGCVAVTEPDYHLYNGNWWCFIPGIYEDPAKTLGLQWAQTQKAADALGIILPETIDGNPVIGYERFNLTTKKVPIQIAWLSPRYVYHSSYYGVEKRELWVTPDGTESQRFWLEGMDLAYGSTEEELWRRQFGYDENDVFTGGNYTLADMPVEEIFSFDCDGTTLYVARIIVSTMELPLWDVTWVDYSRNAVFSLDGYFEYPRKLIDCAQDIIELNK